MTAPSVIYLNGDFLDEERAFIPITDRGFLFGDGAFTTLRIEKGLTQCFQPHLERLESYCHSLGIAFPKISREILQELIVHNQASEGIWRLKIIITGGSQSALSLTPRAHGQLLMTLKPYQLEEKQEYRLTLYPHPICRPSASLKSLAYLDRLWVAHYASQKNVDDALVTDSNGFVLETAFSNIFWRMGNQLITPDFRLPLLPGIALKMVRLAAERELEIPMYNVYLPLEAIPSEAQIYLCNSLKGIVPVVAIDGKTFSRDLSWEARLINAYHSQVEAHSK